MNKKSLSKEKQRIFLEKMIKNIFGYNVTLDFSKWTGECDRLIIKDIDFNEDLLTVLQKLREDFYVDLTTDGTVERFLGHKTVISTLDVELTFRGEFIKKEKEKEV